MKENAKTPTMAWWRSVKFHSGAAYYGMKWSLS